MCGEAFAPKGTFLPALPPDVRRGFCPQRYFLTGFAAGCAARLCLAGGQQIKEGCAPGFGLRPNGPKAIPGAEPHLFHSRPGKEKPRRTSGGKAVRKYF